MGKDLRRGPSGRLLFCSVGGVKLGGALLCHGQIDSGLHMGMHQFVAICCRVQSLSFPGCILGVPVVPPASSLVHTLFADSFQHRSQFINIK